MTDHTTLIKERLSIVDVVGSYVKLEKSGRNYKACCPFHGEKTPSFFVVPDKNIFHCFGCGKGGDIFTFVEEIEGSSFQEALKTLADRAGVELTKHAGTEKGKYDRLYHALELATRFFEVHLRKDPEVVNYLLERGLTKETITAFRIGYVPDVWNGLKDRLLAAGVTHDELVAVGLIITKDGRSFDRFRNRIMFPLADSQGRIVGFSGRIYDPRKGAHESAKYMNSPETPLYHKGSMLYGYDKAKKAMRDANQCLMVEGQFDVVLAHQAGTTHAVALSGTGLTTEHCALIKRFTYNLVLSLDGDEAGVRASRRSVLLALREGLSVAMLPLPPGDDPASVIARSTDAWQTLVASAIRPVLELELEFLAQEPVSRQRSFTHEHIFPLIRAQTSSIMQDKSIGMTAHALGVSADALRKEFTVWNREYKEDMQGNPLLVTTAPQQQPVEDMFLGIAGLLAEKYKPIYSDMERAYALYAGQGALEQLMIEHSDRIPQLTFIAEHTFGTDEEQLKKVSEEILVTMEQRILAHRLTTLTVQANHAEKANADSEHQKLLQELALVTNRLHELRHQRSTF